MKEGTESGAPPSLSDLFFFIFGYTLQHVGPQFSDQGWDLCPCIGRQSLNSWTTGKCLIFK